MSQFDDDYDYSDLDEDSLHWEDDSQPSHNDFNDDLTSRIANHDLSSESDYDHRQQFADDVREKIENAKVFLEERSNLREEQRNYEDAKDEDFHERISSIEDRMSLNFGEHWEP